MNAQPTLRRRSARRKRTVSETDKNFPNFLVLPFRKAGGTLRSLKTSRNGPRTVSDSEHRIKGKFEHRPYARICPGMCTCRLGRVCRVMNDATIQPTFPASGLDRPIVGPRNPNVDFARLVRRSAFLSAEFDFLLEEVGSRPAEAFSDRGESFSGPENPFARRRNHAADRGDLSAEPELTVWVRRTNSALRKALRFPGRSRVSSGPANFAHALPDSPSASRLPRAAFRVPSFRKGVVP